MKESKLNKILPRSFNLVKTGIDPNSITNSGLGNVSFRLAIKEILKNEEYTREDLPRKNRVSKFSSKTKKGNIFCAHYSNEVDLPNDRRDYSLTYIGVKKEDIKRIEEEISNKYSLKILY
jgi:hypothetical protein